jgi:hypothetical protein
MKPPIDRPPVYALLVDLTGWTLDRTASLPKSQRFTFGERLDRLTLDCLELAIEAIYASPPDKPAPLRRMNQNLEKLRVFWRLVCDRGWISQQQLLFVSQRLEEIGRMVGGWLKQVERKVQGGIPERGHSGPPGRQPAPRTEADKNVRAPDDSRP